MSDWSEVSPPCPWCWDEISDMARDEFDRDGRTVTDCGGCGQPVEVEGATRVVFRARKVEASTS